jgi:hypothetical protein
MAEWKTYVTLAPQLRERVDHWAAFTGISRAAAIAVLLSQALDAQVSAPPMGITVGDLADAYVSEDLES